MIQNLEEMVERVSWFSPIDYEILLFYEDHDILASPKVISVNIDYNRQYTSKRLNALSNHEIIHKDEDSGLFGLTDKGRKFLAGELDASELERDDE